MRTLKLVAALLMVLSIAGTVLAQPPAPEIPGGTVVASGFNGPQGVAVDADGNVWVIDSGTGGPDTVEVTSPETGEKVQAGMGNTARIVKVAPDGTQTEVATLPSILLGQESLGGARLALLNGVLYATSGGWSDPNSDAPALLGTLVRVDDGGVTQVADTWSFEKENNPDQTLQDSHPYGLAAGPDGWLWLADAGANDLLRVNPDTGEIQVVAAFAGLPSPMPNPNRNNANESDPVPTGVAFDAEGNAYVSLLSGFPFLPGGTKVLRVTPQGEVSDYATGLTTLTDIARGPDGNLYAVSFGQFSEQGPQPNTGAVLRINEGTGSEVLVDALPFPTSIAFDADGNAYVVVNSVGAPGSGAVVRFDHLTEMAGEPLPTPAAQ